MRAAQQGDVLVRMPAQRAEILVLASDPGEGLRSALPFPGLGVDGARRPRAAERQLIFASPAITVRWIGRWRPRGRPAPSPLSGATTAGERSRAARSRRQRRGGSRRGAAVRPDHTDDPAWGALFAKRLPRPASAWRAKSTSIVPAPGSIARIVKRRSATRCARSGQRTRPSGRGVARPDGPPACLPPRVQGPRFRRGGGRACRLLCGGQFRDRLPAAVSDHAA